MCFAGTTQLLIIIIILLNIREDKTMVFNSISLHFVHWNGIRIIMHHFEMINQEDDLKTKATYFRISFRVYVLEI